MIALGALAATVVLMSGAPPAATAAATAEAAAERLRARVSEARAEARPLEAEEVRGALDEARAALKAGGYSTDLARALTTVGSENEEESSPARTLGLVERRLGAFARAAQAVDPAVPPDARDRARAVLDDPIFRVRPARAGPLERLLYELRQWVGHLLGATASFAAANWRWLLAISIVALVCALALALRFVARRFSTVGRTVPDRPVMRGGTSPTEASTWLDRARREMAAGRRLEALRLLAAAALLALRQRGLLPDEPGLTLLEALRHVERSEVEPSLARLAELHERQVYARGQGADEELALAFDLTESLVTPRAVTP